MDWKLYSAANGWRASGRGYSGDRFIATMTESGGGWDLYVKLIHGATTYEAQNSVYGTERAKAWCEQTLAQLRGVAEAMDAT